MSFIHLNVRSSYSLMKSTIKVKELVEQAKELGYDSLALTDEGVMSGSVSFYKHCKENGIKPILGMHAEVQHQEESYSVIFLARNNEGYQNLLALSSIIQLDKRPLQFKELHIHHKGLLIILISSFSSLGASLAEGNIKEAANIVQPWYDLFADEDIYLSVEEQNSYLERQIQKPLKKWAEAEDIQVTAISDVRYLTKDDDQAYQCLRAIDEGSRLEIDQMPMLPKSFDLKPESDLESYFLDWWPEVLLKTEEIGDKCQVELEFGKHLIPSYPVPDKKTAAQYLRELCEEALQSKYTDRYQTAEKRMNHELDIIISMNFSDYFLIVWDFVHYARSRGIHAGPGRGSAAGSIVAYLLNITQVDPLHYHLLFERFLNPERISMPDIDIDFPDHRRDEVIAYVADKYGTAHVAQICTFGTFASRSVLRELFKVMSIDQNDASFILKQLPFATTHSLVKLVQASEDLKNYIRQSNKLQLLFRIATKLEGLPRHISTHAAGVVISEQPLVKHTAVMPGQGDVHLTQLAMGDLESIGLLKMDFLGLRNLTFIERMEQRIRKNQNQAFRTDEIPLDDPSTFQLLQQGKTIGVFQLESQGMRGVLERLKPTRFEDVVAVNALYRPGPMDYIPVFIKRKHGGEQVTYPHPDVEAILKDTFGVLVYQEQIMQVAQKVAGYSLGQADLLRRAVSKKQQKVLKEQEDEFMKGCKRQGYSQDMGKELFNWIVKFSNYGFNRSHAVAYSLISYRLAYLKAHYPSYFLAELMNSHLGDRQKLSAYLREARELNVKVKGPSINQSYTLCVDERGSIRIGLIAIKGVGLQAVEAILEERQQGRFKGLNDFCLRVVHRAVSRSVIEALILSGAFDELQQNRAQLLASIDQALEQGELFKEFQGQTGLFGEELQTGEDFLHVEPFPIFKQLAMEKEVLGTYISEHPLEAHRNSLRKHGVLSIDQIFFMKKNGKIETASVVESVKEIRTKRGEPMAFVTLSDETSEMDAVLFPNVYREYRSWLNEQMLVSVKGKTEKRNDKVQLIVEKISPFEAVENHEEERRIFIRIQEKEEQESLDFLKATAEYFPGNATVLIFRADKRETYQLGPTYSLAVHNACLDRLKSFFGDSSVAVRTQRHSNDSKN
ncbi:DNA polymerase III subunit alpha [Halobacillus salinarum]|uniref:DNA polymerase III subunit alpha n=1 Tax=Halobacillus salinarum TaxID=2932257 RepID=A0ABY4ENX6_9BACI|nr:DNA polymerase III subunit alpha [Halobacillus salinarum]UOQ46163.1 DNA polymerase III subunit alpha [Halobacillus salinarum]